MQLMFVETMVPGGGGADTRSGQGISSLSLCLRLGDPGAWAMPPTAPVKKPPDMWIRQPSIARSYLAHQPPFVDVAVPLNRLRYRHGHRQHRFHLRQLQCCSANLVACGKYSQHVGTGQPYAGRLRKATAKHPAQGLAPHMSTSSRRQPQTGQAPTIDLHVPSPTTPKIAASLGQDCMPRPLAVFPCLMHLAVA